MQSDHLVDTYVDAPILASPLEPAERQVREALLKMNDPSLRTIICVARKAVTVRRS